MTEAIKQVLIEIDNNHASLTASEALNKLLEYDNQAVFDAISEFMNDTSINRMTWIICANMLARLDKFKANERLVDELQFHDPDRRYRVVKIFALYGTSHVVNELIQLLNDDSYPEIRILAAQALGSIGDKRAISSLEWAAKNDHEVDYEDCPVSYVAQKALQKLK